MPEPCEVCGQPATVNLIDVKEADPIRDEQGIEWMTWKQDGPVHHYCDDHYRASKMTYRPETPESVRAEVTIQDHMAREAYSKMEKRDA